MNTIKVKQYRITAKKSENAKWLLRIIVSFVSLRKVNNDDVVNNTRQVNLPKYTVNFKITKLNNIHKYCTQLNDVLFITC